PAGRQGRLGHGPDERGAAPIHRQGFAPRLCDPGLLEPSGERAGVEQRDEEAGRNGEAGAGREAHAGGGREEGRGIAIAPTPLRLRLCLAGGVRSSLSLFCAASLTAAVAESGPVRADTAWAKATFTQAQTLADAGAYEQALALYQQIIARE